MSNVVSRFIATSANKILMKACHFLIVDQLCNLEVKRMRDFFLDEWRMIIRQCWIEYI